MGKHYRRVETWISSLPIRVKHERLNLGGSPSRRLTRRVLLSVSGAQWLSVNVKLTIYDCIQVILSVVLVPTCIISLHVHPTTFSCSPSSFFNPSYSINSSTLSEEFLYQKRKECDLQPSHLFWLVDFNNSHASWFGGGWGWNTTEKRRKRWDTRQMDFALYGPPIVYLLHQFRRLMWYCSYFLDLINGVLF